MKLSRRTLILIEGLGAIALGLLYSQGAFGPAEAELASWGTISWYLGLLLVAGAWLRRQPLSGWSRYPVMAALAVLTAMQLLPILLWLLFSGSGISDGSPPSTFVAHWAYALPHLLVMLLGLYLLWPILRDWWRQRGQPPRKP